MFKRILILILLCSAFLVGCSKADTNLIKQDVIDYISSKHYKEFVHLEKSVISKMNDVLSTNYIEDQSLLKSINTIYLEYKLLNEKLNSIRPNTEELRAIHELCIEGHNKQFSALLQIRMANVNKNKLMKNGIDEDISDAQEMLRDYNNRLKELSKGLKVKVSQR